MLIPLVLGAIQGVSEWLPVSSEGIVAVAYAWVLDRPLTEAVSFALWLHIGTAGSALVALRREVRDILIDLFSPPFASTALTRFLIVATVSSVVVGVPLLLTLNQLSARLGSAAMGLVGAFMLVTATLQWKRPKEGTRNRQQTTIRDAVFIGAAQGVAALPGISRSGTTIAALLARGLEKREALVISFLMSVPASLGVALYTGLTSRGILVTDGLLAAALAGAVGLVTIKILLAFAERVNVALFVAIVGAVIIAGSLLQALS